MVDTGELSRGKRVLPSVSAQSLALSTVFIVRRDVQLKLYIWRERAQGGALL